MVNKFWGALKAFAGMVLFLAIFPLIIMYLIARKSRLQRVYGQDI